MTLEVRVGQRVVVIGCRMVVKLLLEVLPNLLKIPTLSLISVWPAAVNTGTKALLVGTRNLFAPS